MSSSRSHDLLSAFSFSNGAFIFLVRHSKRWRLHSPTMGGLRSAQLVEQLSAAQALNPPLFALIEVFPLPCVVVHVALAVGFSLCKGVAFTKLLSDVNSPPVIKLRLISLASHFHFLGA